MKCKVEGAASSPVWEVGNASFEIGSIPALLLWTEVSSSLSSEGAQALLSLGVALIIACFEPQMICF